MALVARGVAGGSDINVLMDSGATADMQIVKLAYSAAGGQTIIGADANGLDVDVTRIIPGTLATELGKAEDALAASGDTGVFALVIRRDTPVADSAAGDYQGLHVDAVGNLWIAGSQVEDVAAVSGDRGVFILAVRRDTPTSGAAAGDYHELEVDALGRLWVTGTQTEDAAHTSGDTGQFMLGVASLARTARGADNDYEPIAVDLSGAVFGSNVPEANSAWACSNYAALAAASGVIKAAAGKLYGVTLTNDNAAARYIQFFNLTAVPADTTAPLFTIKLGIGETRQLDFSMMGKYFSTGICWCNSTTGATKTIGAADTYVEARYL